MATCSTGNLFYDPDTKECGSSCSGFAEYDSITEKYKCVDACSQSYGYKINGDFKECLNETCTSILTVDTAYHATA